ncbi:MAG: hypothetical protein HQ523_03550 [Lentisphaerae bacterium]|nr:hypothetical protein [Lentisphaerota bacterium]
MDIRLPEIPDEADPTFSYRPIIVWAMNDVLDTSELERQLNAFKASGYGGVMVMPWGGLPYDFMCDEWLEFVRFILVTAQAVGLDIWLWDDWLFSSGPAGGKATENPAHRAKELQVTLNFIVEAGEPIHAVIPPRTLSARCFSVDKFGFPDGGYAEALPVSAGDTIQRVAEARTRIMTVGWAYRSGMQHTTRSHAEFLDPELDEVQCDIKTCEDAEVWSVDMMNPDAIAQYVELIHERYWQAVPEFFGNTLKGFFYDEPMVPTDRPWTQDFAARFRELKGYDLCDHLIAVMAERHPPVDPATADYRDVWTSLVAETFYRTIQTWCHAHGVMAAGHQIGDNSLHEILSTGGHFFKNMRFADVPGVDSAGGWGGRIEPGLFLDFPRLPGSSASVHGHPRAMSESFAVYGHGTDLNHMRYVCEHQLMRGVNTFFCKLSNYNREKSYYFHPPELSDHNPIIQRFGTCFGDRIETVARLISEGTPAGPLLAVYVPSANYYACDDTIGDRLTALAEALTYSQVEFVYLIDPDILNLSRPSCDGLAGSSVAGPLISRTGSSYSHMVIPAGAVIPSDVRAALDAFEPGVVCDLATATVADVVAAYRGHGGRLVESTSINVPVSMRSRTAEEGVQHCMLLNESCAAQRVILRVASRVTVCDVDLDPGLVHPALERGEDGTLTIELAPSESRVLRATAVDKPVAPSNDNRGVAEVVTLAQWSVTTPDGEEHPLQNKLADWCTLGFGGFTGVMRYRCEFVWESGATRAVLALGDVCYAATVLLDGRRIGDCVFAPFKVTLADLSKGMHVLEVDVLNTPANAIYGDDETLAERRAEKVFKGTYAFLYEPQDISKLRSGLFGPVTLSTA